MRINFLIAGVLALFLAALGVRSALTKHQHIWFLICSQPPLIISGTVLIIAAVRNYRGHWSFLVGLVLLTAAFHGIGFEVEDAIAAHRMVRWSPGILLILVSAICGLLSLLSAHKLHRYAIVQGN